MCQSCLIMIKLNGTGPTCMKGRSKCSSQFATNQEEDSTFVEIVFHPFDLAEGDEVALSLNSAFLEKNAFPTFHAMVGVFLLDDQELLEELRRTNFTSVYAFTLSPGLPLVPPPMDNPSTQPPNDTPFNGGTMLAVSLWWSWALARSLAWMVGD
mmetsp:Transcript_2032/g.13091  ORF Transcript_2032/g.13091 Transcript_2032/m.13091 type:complete len:154 (-) Transcript_2032:4341-4802(-)